MYKIKPIPKNRDILENSRYESKQDEYMRLIFRLYYLVIIRENDLQNKPRSMYTV